MSNLRTKSFSDLNKAKGFIPLEAGFRRNPSAPFKSLTLTGFTLIELIVTMAVLLVITTISLAGYPEFNQRVALKKTVQEIALVIRQAQAYGLGVKEYEPGSGVYPGYGVKFNLAEPAKFVLFADLNDDKVYSSVIDGLTETFKIKSGDKIVELCGDGGSGLVCGFISIDIVYYRPSPVVDIKANETQNLTNAEIKIKAPNGQEKKITVWQSGQISVQ